MWGLIRRDPHGNEVSRGTLNMIDKTFVGSALLGLALMLATLAPVAHANSYAAPPPAQSSGQSSVQPVSLQYRLGAGDKLRVIVFGEEALGGEFIVSSEGTVELPLIGAVKASGLTISEFQGEVERALKDGYLKDPRVSAEVENYRPFFILGEVQKPGQYPYTSSLSVMNAVATAQGFTYRADTHHVFIKHLNEAGEHRESLSDATQVLPGDTIRIPERIF